MKREPNAELAWKVYDRIEGVVKLEEDLGEPLSEGWNQATWASRYHPAEAEAAEVAFCRTTYCFAGWACKESGDEILLDAPSAYDSTCLCDVCVRARGHQDRTVSAQQCRSSDTGRIRGIRNRAQDLLGLTEAQSDDLFNGAYAGLDQLEGRVRRIFGPRPGEPVSG